MIYTSLFSFSGKEKNNIFVWESPDGVQTGTGDFGYCYNAMICSVVITPFIA